jgi:hypothetical protein
MIRWPGGCLSERVWPSTLTLPRQTRARRCLWNNTKSIFDLFDVTSLCEMEFMSVVAKLDHKIPVIYSNVELCLLGLLMWI